MASFRTSSRVIHLEAGPHDVCLPARGSDHRAVTGILLVVMIRDGDRPIDMWSAARMYRDAASGAGALYVSRDLQGDEDLSCNLLIGDHGPAGDHEPAGNHGPVEICARGRFCGHLLVAEVVIDLSLLAQENAFIETSSRYITELWRRPEEILLGLETFLQDDEPSIHCVAA